MSERRGERKFLKYLLKHDKEEPVIIGPGGVFYITDHHHLARALYELDQSHTYCMIVDNLSNERVDDFWKSMEENNEVYLKDQNGKEITPSELPASIKDLSNDPFRSLAGAVRESCGFEKDAKAASGEDYLEFQWADYLGHTGLTPALRRMTLTQTSIPPLAPLYIWPSRRRR